MNGNRKKGKKQVANNNSVVNVLSQEEISKRVTKIQDELRSYTWRELETRGKFDKNAKISFISEDMLILGCDIGSETHYARAIDLRGRELSEEAFEFSNSSAGFQSMKAWAIWRVIPTSISCRVTVMSILRGAPSVLTTVRTRCCITCSPTANTGLTSSVLTDSVLTASLQCSITATVWERPSAIMMTISTVIRMMTPYVI